MEDEIKNESKNNKRGFFKDKKNIAITILSILLFCAFCAYTTPPIDSTQYENQIKDLQNQINELQTNNNQLQTEKTSLEEEKTKLEENNKALEEQKNNLENEKQELIQKVDELAKAKEEKNSNVAKTETPYTTSTTSNKDSSSSVVATSQNTDNSQMVWVGDTGSKYHKQNCRTLKGNGHQITMQEAIAEGREACQICY